MDEYIKREAAIKAMEKADYTLIANDADSCKADYLREIIESVPAADVVPVVHGRWENGNPICPICGEDKFKDLDADIWCDWQPDYCPNCGAKMSGGKKDD